MKKRTSSKIIDVIVACLIIVSMFGALPSTTYAANFGIGDTVEVYNTGGSGLLVRDDPCGNVISGKFDGDRGVVLDGPVYCNNYNRWLIRWNDGLEGWSAENWLKKVSQPPSPPSHISPSNGATGVSLTPTFRWSAVSSADRYGLYVSEPPYGPANLVYENENLTGTSVSLPSGRLSEGVTYYWNMRAHNSADWGSFSLSWSFTTLTTPPPNQLPTCSLSANPRSGNAPLTVTFTMSASDPDGSISAWVMDVDGDGQADYSGTGSPPSTRTHTYTASGNYSVVLMVSDNRGDSAHDTETINVGSANQPPTCSLSASPGSGSAPLSVTFTLSASDSDGSISSWALDVDGDGTTDFSGNGTPPSTRSYTYTSQGNYTAVLMVSDNDDATASDTETISISSISLPDLVVNDIQVEPSPPTAGGSTTISITVKNQGDTDATGTFFLEFYFDGTYKGHVYVNGLAAGASKTSSWSAQTWPSDTNPHTIRGVVDPDNAVSESDEGYNELSKQFTAAVNQLPTCSILANPRSGDAPLTVTFSISASDSDGSISAWVLDVDGDGNADYSGTGAPPSTKTHTYTNPGTYSVALMVSDNNSANASDTETVNVGTNNPPTCSLTATPRSGNAPLAVTFSMSASDSDGSISAWALDADGDGTTDFSGNGTPPSTRSYTYTSQGNYTAVLMVSDNNDATASDTEAISVSPPSPGPDLIIEEINWSPTSPSIGDTATFTVTIKNQGTSKAGSSKVYYFIDNAQHGYDYVNSIDPGATATETFTWKAQDGPHAIKSVADYKEQVAESDETNNEKAVTYSATALSDLVIQNINWSPTSPSIGETVTFTVTIKNQGTGEASSSEVYYFIDDIEHGYDYVNSIDPGATATETFTWKAQDGPHAIKSVADYKEEVVESDENNNEKTITFPGGDITLTLYVHEDSASGPVILGARVTGQDGGGNSFDKTTNSSGYVTITGAPGTWSFTASKSGYNANSWSQDITSTTTKHAYLVKQTEVGQVILTQPVHITPPGPYFVGDYLTATFTVKNIGGAAITLDKLLLGGRFNGGELPTGGYPDFTYESVTLQPGDTHRYEGTFTIPESGSYDFFVAYYMDNPTEAEKQFLDENNWNIAIELGEGLTDADRVGDIAVEKTRFEKTLKISFIADPGWPDIPPIETGYAKITITYELMVNEGLFLVQEIFYRYEGDLWGASSIKISTPTGEMLWSHLITITGSKQQTFYPKVKVSSEDIITLYITGRPSPSWLDLIPLDDPIGLLDRVVGQRAETSVTFDPLDVPGDPFLEYLEDKELIYVASPAELRVYDSQGRVTGLVEGELKEEIPNSLSAKNTVLIFDATDSYRYEVVGTAEGTYGLNVASVKEQKATEFVVTDILTSDRAVHRYTVDWDALRRGEPSIGVQIDSDGDNTFEQTKIVQPPIASFVFSPISAVTDEEIGFDASESRDVDGEIVSYKWNFGDVTASTGRLVKHAYSAPGEYIVTLAVIDNDGLLSTYSKVIQVEQRQVALPTWVLILISIVTGFAIAFGVWRRMGKKQSAQN